MQIKILHFGTIEEAFQLKNELKNSVLVGERHGKKCEGFDYGKSPSTITTDDVKGKCIIHTTSAGMQGIINATKASEIITGSLANAKAAADYILEKQPETVSLVCMGNGGVRPALGGKGFICLPSKMAFYCVTKNYT